MVYLRSMRIHIWDIWRNNIWGVYVVYVWTWSECEDGIKYISNSILTLTPCPYVYYVDTPDITPPCIPYVYTHTA
jgi:hypothetical protein